MSRYDDEPVDMAETLGFISHISRLDKAKRKKTYKRKSKVVKKIKRIRLDHPLLVKVREIEDQIGSLCKEMTDAFGLDIGWSDARELAGGMTLAQLRKLDKM